MGEARAEAMLKEIIETDVAMGERPAQVEHVNVDTTVQTKAFRHPTDARLYNRARERLVMEQAINQAELRECVQVSGDDGRPLCASPADASLEGLHQKTTDLLGPSDP